LSWFVAPLPLSNVDTKRSSFVPASNSSPIGPGEKPVANDSSMGAPVPSWGLFVFLLIGSPVAASILSRWRPMSVGVDPKSFAA
jgi:hypothetical protein